MNVRLYAHMSGQMFRKNDGCRTLSCYDNDHATKGRTFCLSTASEYLCTGNSVRPRNLSANWSYFLTNYIHTRIITFHLVHMYVVSIFCKMAGLGDVAAAAVDKAWYYPGSRESTHNFSSPPRSKSVVTLRFFSLFTDFNYRIMQPRWSRDVFFDFLSLSLSFRQQQRQMVCIHAPLSAIHMTNTRFKTARKRRAATILVWYRMWACDFALYIRKLADKRRTLCLVQVS